ncbi:hypothetical protein [Mycobacterium szulgai]|uniref:hypothetical protein n=1 Tax=Mycobacterium szulgai TaxID=1787 RepID=UPI001FEA4B87|nr:hypothetical protein [Mycobacterium szulgai]
MTTPTTPTTKNAHDTAARGEPAGAARDTRWLPASSTQTVTRGTATSSGRI